jgi:hypothetical protein
MIKIKNKKMNMMKIMMTKMMAIMVMALMANNKIKVKYPRMQIF